MKKYLRKRLFLSILIIISLQVFVLPQKLPKKVKAKSSLLQKSYGNFERQRLKNCLPEPKDSVSYYSPIRYVIVYDWLFDTKEIPERRIEVLMNPEQFNEKNLICVFSKISNRFPSPSNLYIKVHTSLITIETPEEREMPKSSSDPRFSHTYEKYKTANYLRYSSGKENFIYTTELLPEYKTKVVQLSDKKIP